MKVLILSQRYDPEPLPKPADLARALRDDGHSVEVITGFPHYPVGRIYEGYRRALLRRETRDGIRIWRTFEYPYQGKSIVRRLMSYGSFVVSAPLAGLLCRKPDVLYVFHPPLTVGIVAWIISRLRRVPFVYDVQDIWPESAVVTGFLREGRFVRMIRRLESFIYARADEIYVVTEGARRNLIGKGVPPEKLRVMHHFVDESKFGDVPEGEVAAARSRYGWGDDFIVLFAGNIGIAQGLQTVVEAGARLRRGERIRFVLVGDGSDRARLEKLVDEGDLRDRVQFIERQPMSAMPPILAAADLLLVHLLRCVLSDWVIPTKTTAYLAAGKPILAAMEGAAADLIVEARAGTAIRSEDPAALVDEVRRVAATSPDELRARGANGRAYLEQQLSMSRIVPTYLASLTRVARRREHANS